MNSFRESDRKGACHIYAFISRTNVTHSSAFLESLRTILALVFAFIFDCTDRSRERFDYDGARGYFLFTPSTLPRLGTFRRGKKTKNRDSILKKKKCREKRGRPYCLMPPVGDDRCEVYMNLIRGL